MGPLALGSWGVMVDVLVPEGLWTEDATWSLDGCRLELQTVWVAGKLAVLRDPNARKPDQAPEPVPQERRAWDHFTAALADVLAGLADGEVVEFALYGRQVLEAGRAGDAVVALGFGPSTPASPYPLTGEQAEQLRGQGWQPPDAAGDDPGPREGSWWQEASVGAQRMHFELVAGLVAAAPREVHDASTPADLSSTSSISAGSTSSARPGGLGPPGPA